MTARHASIDDPEQPVIVADLESLFQLHYGRINRLIANITRNPGCAEELAAEVFVRFTKSRVEYGPDIAGWLTRAAIRIALDEVRRRNRSARLDKFAHLLGFARTPEELYIESDQNVRVMKVLGTLKSREAELLLLRAEGMSYEDLASALSLNPVSVGKLLSRAQEAFRKEYVKRYGNE